MLLAALAVAAVGASAYFYYRSTQGAERERDQDYLRVLDLACRRHALRTARHFWEDEAPESPLFREPAGREAAKLVADRCADRDAALERREVTERREFAGEHGRPAEAWRDSFAARYPEWADLFDEAAAATRQTCRRQLQDLESRLLSPGGPPEGDEFALRRTRLLTDRSAGLVIEVVAAVDALASLQRLRAKVGSGRGR
jgi:hypothetical protein